MTARLKSRFRESSYSHIHTLTHSQARFLPCSSWVSCFVASVSFLLAFHVYDSARERVSGSQTWMGRLEIEEASWFSFMKLFALSIFGPEFSTVISVFVLNHF